MKIKFTLNELSFISLRYQMLTNSSRGPAFNVLAFPSSCTEKLESFGADGFCLVSESESLTSIFQYFSDVDVTNKTHLVGALSVCTALYIVHIDITDNLNSKDYYDCSTDYRVELLL